MGAQELFVIEHIDVGVSNLSVAIDVWQTREEAEAEMRRGVWDDIVRERVVRYVPEDTAAATKLAFHRARAKLLLERFERERLPGEVVEALRELAGEP
ncbi:MAG TPA: hypothetical protein VFR23_24430 [Jiangellaceae bacterium]|nr:hypothetical protein [Jiangellaceae bacterium]